MTHLLSRYGFTKQNVLLVGPGGVGKTYLIRKIYTDLARRNIGVALTALTGIAAVNLGGQTLHSWAGIQLGTESPQVYAKKLRVQNAFRHTQVLIIDEVSMLSVALFELLNTIAKLVRGNTRLFGGMSLLLVGDMCQLPPVQGKFFFLSGFFDYSEFHIHRLHTPKRYGNLDWFHMLLRIRYGNETDADVAMIESRLVGDAKIVDADGIMPTELYPTRKDTDEINHNEYVALPGPEMEYTALDFARIRGVYGSINNFSSQERQSIHARARDLAPEFLQLKVGTQVMHTVNNPNAKIFNGSRGIVVKIEPHSVDVNFIDVGVITIIPHRFESLGVDNVYRHQLPLKYAWAITIHKSQSLTLDRVCVDIGETVFSNNMTYVALSRCKSLEGLYVRKFDRDRISVHPDAAKFEEYIDGICHQNNIEIE